jgi:large subunit ribosomal protein L29
MKAFELRELPEDEIRKRIKDEEVNLTNLKFQKATSQLESPIRVRTVRRDIARMKTVLREKELKRVQASQQAAPATEETK